MTALYIVLAILVVLIVYLLTAPFYFEIDTTKELFRVRFHVLAGARLLGRNGALYVRWRILGFGREINLMSLQGKARPNKVTANSSKDSFNPRWPKIRNAINSFKVNKFSVRLDTNDMALNGILFPMFATASWLTRKELWITFNQQNELILEIENNAFRLLKAYLSPTH